MILFSSNSNKKCLCENLMYYSVLVIKHTLLITWFIILLIIFDVISIFGTTKSMLNGPSALSNECGWKMNKSVNIL